MFQAETAKKSRKTTKITFDWINIIIFYLSIVIIIIDISLYLDLLSLQLSCTFHKIRGLLTFLFWLSGLFKAFIEGYEYLWHCDIAFDAGFSFFLLDDVPYKQENDLGDQQKE